MTHPASGNPTWQDYPNTSTPVTAASLEAIEGALDQATSGSADRPFARYYCNINPPDGQYIAADGGVKNIPFDVAQSTHPDVARAANMAQFTLNRAGVWTITAGLRMRSMAAARHQFVIWNTSSSVTRYGEVATDGTSFSSWNVSAQRRFSAGQVIGAGLAILTSSGGGRIATDVPESTFISFLWERP